MRAFLAGSGEGAVCRATARGGVRLVEQTLVRHQYASLDRPGKGLGAALHRPADGSEPGTGDAIDHGLSPRPASESGRSISVPSSPPFTRRPMWELLAYVDKAHGNLSGPATRTSGAGVQRIPSGCLSAGVWDLGGAPVPVAHTAAYRKRNTGYQPTRPTPILIGERRRPQPHGVPGYLRIDTVHQGDQDGRKGNLSTSTLWTRSPNGKLWPPPRKSRKYGYFRSWRRLLEQFPFVIRGFHSTTAASSSTTTWPICSASF